MNDSVSVKPDGKARRRKASRTGCAVEITLSVIGGVWKPIILFHLLDLGTLRFNGLSRILSSATPRMLTLQLRELEADGIIVRTIYPEVPPKVEYSLSPLGRTLAPMLFAMRDWGDEFKKTVDVDGEHEDGNKIAKESPGSAQCDV